MNNTEMFKSKILLTFVDSSIESDFKVYQSKFLFSHNLVFLVVGLLLFVLALTQPTIQFKQTAESFGCYQYYISACIAAGLQIISTVLVIVYKRNVLINRIASNYNYISLSISLGLTRYFYINIISVNLILYYAMMIIEFVLRHSFFAAGVLQFSEGCISTFVIFCYYWGTYPMKVTAVETQYQRTLMYSCILICSVIMSYFASKQFRTSFYYSAELGKKNKWYESIIDNMNTGFLHIKQNSIAYINRTMVSQILSNEKLLAVISPSEFNNHYNGTGRTRPNDQNNHETDAVLNIDSVDTDKLKMISPMILQYLLTDIVTEDSASLDHQSQQDRLCYKLLLNMFKEKLKKSCKNNDFTLLGVKTIHISDKSQTGEELSDTVLEVYCRYYSTNTVDEFEFIFNNVTRTKINEERNAEFKYKTVFLSKVAHEFKNPLVCITELVDQINDQEHLSSKKTSRKCLDQFHNLPVIKSLSNYMLILIKDFDYFSASQIKTQIHCEFADTDLEDLLNFCKEVTLALLNKSNKSETVEFSVSLPENIPTKIWTDEIKLKQVLINLISNSIKFTYRGKITLSLKMVGPRLEFRVEDTGIGMSEHQQKHLFRPFTKGNMKNNIGTGLGLTIVKDLIKLLGGKIKFSTETDKGSQFWFSLPVQEVSVVRSNSCYYSSSPLLLHCSENPGNRLQSPSRTKSRTQVELSLPKQVSMFKRAQFKLATLKSNNMSSDTVILDTIEFSDPLSCFSANKTGRNRNQNPRTRQNNFNVATGVSNSGFPSKSFSEHSSDINILVADDEVLTRNSAIRMLTKAAAEHNLKLNIIEASDGVEVLLHLINWTYNSRKIHAVLSDETMTYMRGSECANIWNRITDFKQWNSIPFYILTAYEDTKTLQFIRSNKVTDIFTKPLRKTMADNLLTAIK